MNATQLEYGDIDIYLFDQILKGRFDNADRILDAGCGWGRNSYHFLKRKYNLYAIDQQEEAIEGMKSMASELYPGLPHTNFTVADLDNLPFENEYFDVVICNAVLHFAENKAHFERMLASIWRVLKRNGYLFVRLASTLGLEDRMVAVGNDRYLLPDGSERFLVTHDQLLQYTHHLNGELFEPLKTTHVHNLRSMTTWCVQKL